MAVEIPYNKFSNHRELLFTKCCFCFPLRIGCFVLGYLNVLYNSLHTLYLLAGTIFVGIATHGFQEFDNLGVDVDDQEISKNVPFAAIVGTILIIILLINFAWLIINIACLVGIHKKRPGHVRSYVAFSTVRLVLYALGIVIKISSAKADADDIILNMIDIALTGYFTLVYYVYAKQMELEQMQDVEKPVVQTIPDKAVFIYPSNINEKI